LNIDNYIVTPILESIFGFFYMPNIVWEETTKMKPFGRYVALFGIGAAWLTASAIPAMAQSITTATATLICGPPASFTATFSGNVGSVCGDSCEVRYSTVFTPSTGSPIPISQVVAPPVMLGGNFLGSTTFMLPATGPGSLTSGVTYTLTGRATFFNPITNQNFNTIPIAFTNANNQITCGQQPFRDFNAKLAIDLDRKPNEGGFELKSSFTLSSTASIDPVAEPVTLQVGTFTTTIQPGNFTKHPDGSFTFISGTGGAGLEVLIKPTGASRYKFQAEGHEVSLTGTKNPVTVMLTIGNNTGTAKVRADIDH
jgi:hypothetical protein